MSLILLGIGIFRFFQPKNGNVFSLNSYIKKNKYNIYFSKSMLATWKDGIFNLCIKKLYRAQYWI